MSTLSIYMVESATKPGEYMKVPRSKTLSDAYRLEGVDGDEEANTVTYWYRRKREDDE